MKQIKQNKEVSFSVSSEGISGRGVAENLGWILKPENVKIRIKLRNAFSDWYEEANNEQDKNCVILAIHLTQGRIFKDLGAISYNLDFLNKLEIIEENEDK